jgi:hypothetical protein
MANYIGIYTSIVTKEFKDEALKKKFIFSTTKSCGAASDIADLRVTVNLAEPFKSPVLARQTLGRCRADNTLYIDVIDDGFYFTKKYYKAKRPVFQQYAKTCTETYMSEEEIMQRASDLVEKYASHDVMCMPVFKR